MKQTAQAAAVTSRKTAEREPLQLLARIGSTTYKVTIRFSENAKETMEDKILRMIENEAAKNAS
jgi:hypothetical protein